MSFPEFSPWPIIPLRSAPEADFDAKMYAVFQHMATSHRDELLALISYLRTNSTIIGSALNATTIGLATPAVAKFSHVRINTEYDQYDLNLATGVGLNFDGSDAAIKNVGSSSYDVTLDSIGGAALKADTNNTGVGEAYIEVGAERMLTVTDSDFNIVKGRLKLNGNEIGGAEMIIADDAAGSFNTPRNGGFALITASGNSVSSFPAQNFSALVYYDVGATILIQKSPDWTLVGTDVNTVNTDVTGTTGADDKVTVGGTAGVLKVENRSGGPKPFTVTFL